MNNLLVWLVDSLIYFLAVAVLIIGGYVTFRFVKGYLKK